VLRSTSRTTKSEEKFGKVGESVWDRETEGNRGCIAVVLHRAVFKGFVSFFELGNSQFDESDESPD
jgi:hypothetical protein